MLVKLPREVTGQELIEVIQKAAETLKADGYVTESNIEERYEPGSIKRSINSVAISIRKLDKAVKREGFLWLKQKAVKVPKYPAFEFPKLLSDEKYKELNIGAFGMVIQYGLLSTFYAPGEYDYNSGDFDKIRPVFEKLVAGIYRGLTPVAANS